MSAMPESAPAPADAARIGRCLDCNYDLRGLTEHRCPECGRAFDPCDPWTTHLGEARIVRLAARSVRRLPTLVGVSFILVWWGMAWLPGAGFAVTAGLALYAGLLVARIVRHHLCVLAVWRYGAPRSLLAFAYRQWLAELLLIVITAAGVVFTVPLRISLALAEPFARRIWENEPAGAGGPRMLGPLLVSHTDASPRELLIQVPFGGTVGYQFGRTRPQWILYYGSRRQTGPRWASWLAEPIFDR